MYSHDLGLHNVSMSIQVLTYYQKPPPRKQKDAHLSLHAPPSPPDNTKALTLFWSGGLSSAVFPVIIDCGLSAVGPLTARARLVVAVLVAIATPKRAGLAPVDKKASTLVALGSVEAVASSEGGDALACYTDKTKSGGIKYKIYSKMSLSPPPSLSRCVCVCHDRTRTD